MRLSDLQLAVRADKQEKEVPVSNNIVQVGSEG
jgi:hypothetical protein